MPPPEVWGPPIWTLFHVLAEKINENAYHYYVGQIFNVIKTICSALPCPECTNDATIFLAKIKVQDLKTKVNLKNMIYLFHNYVNVKKRRPLYNYSNLEIYKKYNIINVFNRFISVYHTRGNMKLLAESFQRQIILKNVRDWFTRNIMAFTPVQEPSNNIQVQTINEETNNVMEEFIVVNQLEPEVVTTMEPEVVTTTEPEFVTTMESELVTTMEPEVVIQPKTKKGKKKKGY